MVKGATTVAKPTFRPGFPAGGQTGSVPVPTEVPQPPDIQTPEPSGSIPVTPENYGGGSWWVRAGAVLGLLGGASETLLGGIAVATGIAGEAPTLGTSSFLVFGGGVLVLHGIDNIQANARALWTGQGTQTVTSQLVENATGSYVVGEIVNAAIGIIGSVTVGMVTKSVQVASAAAKATVKNVVEGVTIESIVAKSGKSVCDDAFVHFGHEAYDSIKLSESGKSYWFRYSDIKNMTPEQVRGAIGNMAQSGLTGGTRFMHIYDGTKLEQFGKVPMIGISEFISKKIRSVTDLVQTF